MNSALRAGRDWKGVEMLGTHRNKTATAPFPPCKHTQASAVTIPFLWLQEYQMITELQQLQAGCCYDSLMTNEQFGAWFGDMKQLSKKYR